MVEQIHLSCQAFRFRADIALKSQCQPLVLPGTMDGALCTGLTGEGGRERIAVPSSHEERFVSDFDGLAVWS